MNQTKPRKKRLLILLVTILSVLLNVFMIHILIVRAADREETPNDYKIVYFLPEEPCYIEQPEDLRYGFTYDEIYLLAQLLCGDKNIDGDGEYDFDFKKHVNPYEVNKVLGVVMNRVRNDGFPNKVADVVLQKNQFSVMPRNLQANPSEVAIKTVQEWCEAYDRYDLSIQTIPKTHLYFNGNGVTNSTYERR